MPFGLFEQKKSISELQEENERLDAELSVKQKQELIKKLKGHGLSLKDFSGSIKSAINWIRQH